MKKYRFTFFVMALLLCACLLEAAQPTDGTQPGSDDEFSLKTITESPESFKGSPVTMVLRLKGFDVTKNILSFYDEDNRDIEFDVLNWHRDKRLRVCMRSLVNGLHYKVIFTVNDVQNGSISATVQSFVPAFYEKL